MKKLIYILILLFSMFLFTSCEKDDDIVIIPRKIYIESTTHTDILLNNIDYRSFGFGDSVIEYYGTSNSPEIPYYEYFKLKSKSGDNISLKQKTLEETYNNINLSLPQPSGWVLRDTFNYKLLIMADNDTIYYNSQTTPISVSKTLN